MRRTYELEIQHIIKVYLRLNQDGRGEPKKFVEFLRDCVGDAGGCTFNHETLVTVANRMGMTTPISEMIDKLNHEGILLKKGNRMYELV